MQRRPPGGVGARGVGACSVGACSVGARAFGPMPWGPPTWGTGGPGLGRKLPRRSAKAQGKVSRPPGSQGKTPGDVALVRVESAKPGPDGELRRFHAVQRRVTAGRSRR
jgi:hypothetical protein